jgi:hypothetical protein
MHILSVAKLEIKFETTKQINTKIPRKAQHLTGDFFFYLYYSTLSHLALCVSHLPPQGEGWGGAFSSPSPWGRAGERFLG